MRVAVLILGLIIGAFAVRAQQQGQPLIDSLEKALARQPDDTNKVWTYTLFS